jgi:hypothetical protein
MCIAIATSLIIVGIIIYKCLKKKDEPVYQVKTDMIGTL